MSTVESGDWFDIKAMVNIGAFSIPFIKFRNHILKGKREYLLPDGTVAILPEEWFSDFHHLMEVSELRNGETFSIKKYQVPLLSFPSSRNGLAKMVESIKDINQIPETAPPVHLKATLRNYDMPPRLIASAQPIEAQPQGEKSNLAQKGAPAFRNV